jgi:hypothetical protein
MYMSCHHEHALVGSTSGHLWFQATMARVGNNTPTYLELSKLIKCCCFLLINTKEHKKQLMHIYLNARM